MTAGTYEIKNILGSRRSWKLFIVVMAYAYGNTLYTGIQIELMEKSMLFVLRTF